MNNRVCLRRILAWIIDWNLCGLPALLYSWWFSEMLRQRPSFQYMGFVVIFVLLVLLYPVTFVLRDVIFKGRSIGKRIFGLYILDKKTGEPASLKQRILRNVFFFLYVVDGILLLATKQSIGDRLTDTVVIRQHSQSRP